MTAKKTPDLEVIVTVADEHLTKLPAVTRQLKARGLKVTQTMKHTGTIAGSAPREALEQLRGVAGVAAVEASGSVQIAPPDAEIQ
jgi:hypothetical protein